MCTFPVVKRYLLLHKSIAKHPHLQHDSISLDIPYIPSKDNWIHKANITCGGYPSRFSYLLLQLSFIWLVVHKSMMEQCLD